MKEEEKEGARTFVLYLDRRSRVTVSCGYLKIYEFQNTETGQPTNQKRVV